MNKRIQELAKQADNYAYNMNPEQDSYGRAANPRKFQQDRDTKFAELIVRECAQQARDTDLEDVEGGDSDVLRAAKQQILELFGVEE